MRVDPTDFDGGRDFIIRKTMSGKWPDYTTSNWSWEPRALDENERIALEQFPLWNLNEFIGAEPDAQGVEIIKAMFQASLRGEPFDFDSFGSHYRAYQQRGGDSDEVSLPQANRIIADAAPIRSQVQVPAQTFVAPVAEDKVEIVTATTVRETVSAPVVETATVAPTVAQNVDTDAPKVTDTNALLAALRAKHAAAKTA
jgi:hypothetical protein